MATNNPPLLEVKNLRVEFPTRRGTLLAVDNVSFEISPGEVLGVVGESGAGKSLTGNAIIGLLEPPGRIAAGEIRLEGRRIDNLPYEEMRKVRGARIGAIFQDPLTSLNPLYSVGRQLVETIQTHKQLSATAARDPIQPALELQKLAAGLHRIEADLLEGDADPAPDLGGLADHIQAGHRGATGGRRKQRAKHPHRGRLARAVWAQEAEHLARGDGQV